MGGGEKGKYGASANLALECLSYRDDADVTILVRKRELSRDGRGRVTLFPVGEAKGFLT